MYYGCLPAFNRAILSIFLLIFTVTHWETSHASKLLNLTVLFGTFSFLQTDGLSTKASTKTKSERSDSVPTRCMQPSWQQPVENGPRPTRTSACKTTPTMHTAHRRTGRVTTVTTTTRLLGNIHMEMPLVVMRLLLLTTPATTRVRTGTTPI